MTKADGEDAGHWTKNYYLLQAIIEIAQNNSRDSSQSNMHTVDILRYLNFSPDFIESLSLSTGDSAITSSQLQRIGFSRSNAEKTMKGTNLITRLNNILIRSLEYDADLRENLWSGNFDALVQLTTSLQEVSETDRQKRVGQLINALNDHLTAKEGASIKLEQINRHRLYNTVGHFFVTLRNILIFDIIPAISNSLVTAEEKKKLSSILRSYTADSESVGEARIITGGADSRLLTELKQLTPHDSQNRLGIDRLQQALEEYHGSIIAYSDRHRQNKPFEGYRFQDTAVGLSLYLCEEEDEYFLAKIRGLYDKLPEQVRNWTREEIQKQQTSAATWNKAHRVAHWERFYQAVKHYQEIFYRSQNSQVNPQIEQVRLHCYQKAIRGLIDYANEISAAGAPPATSSPSTRVINIEQEKKISPKDKNKEGP